MWNVYYNESDRNVYETQILIHIVETQEDGYVGYLCFESCETDGCDVPRSPLCTFESLKNMISPLIIF